MLKAIWKKLLNKIGSMGDVTGVTLASGSETIAIASTATVYTHYFKLSFGVAFGLWYQATSSGTVNLKIELEESYTTPTTDGSADTNYVVGSGVSDVESALADENAHVKTLSPVPMKYARFKITGGDGNDASTTLSLKVFQQEYNR